MSLAADKLMSIKTLLVFCLGCLLMIGAGNVSAELVSVQLDGAQELIHLDLENGALYIGDDCSPFLYFAQAPASRSKGKSAKEFTVLQSKSRKAGKSAALPARLPASIIVDGDDVEIVTHTVKGETRAKGKAARPQSLTGRSTRGCKG